MHRVDGLKCLAGVKTDDGTESGGPKERRSWRVHCGNEAVTAIHPARQTIMRSSLRAPVVSFVIALLAPASALAQQKAQSGTGIVEAKTESGYQVWFPVDNLAGAGHDPTGDIMKGGGHAIRCPLMRPRLQFVPEMLKSVETL
jgi:hypothetical protein